MLYKFICIEGNIGVGKTSLAKRISRDSNSRLILEEFSNNPFLPKFYKDPEKYAFPLEIFFMAERFQQLREVNEKELFSDCTVSDYFFGKSKLFAQNNLIDDELLLFYQFYDILLSSLPKPNLLVYLHAEIDYLQQNIKKRGRPFEQEITNEYLYNIQEKYLDYFKAQNDFPVLVIDVTNINFMQNEKSYQKILLEIQKPHFLGKHQIVLR